MRKTALALAAFAFSAAAQPIAPPPAGAPAAPTAPPATAGTPAPAGEPQARPAERGTVLEEVSGRVAEVDRKKNRLRVDTASGPVTLSIDRNTMVYTASGLGTVVDVTPGVQIRAGRNADFLAYWVQVRNTPPSSPATPSTPGQGTGPAGGGSAPAGEGAGGTPAPPSAGPGASPGGAGSAGGPSR